MRRTNFRFLFSTFALLISLLYAMVDIDSILGSPTGVPYIQLLYNATQSYAGTVCLSLCIIIITFLGLIGELLGRRATRRLAHLWPDSCRSDLDGQSDRIHHCEGWRIFLRELVSVSVGPPRSSLLSRLRSFALVSVRNQVPTRTIIFTSCFSAALLCISLGSTTALVSFLNTVSRETESSDLRRACTDLSGHR